MGTEKVGKGFIYSRRERIGLERKVFLEREGQQGTCL